MRSCWAAAPKDRPLFKAIVRSITILLWLDDEHESAHDDESAVAETSFSRFDERSHRAQSPEDGDVEEWESVTDPEYLVIIESPILLSSDETVENV